MHALSLDGQVQCTLVFGGRVRYVKVFPINPSAFDALLVRLHMCSFQDRSDDKGISRYLNMDTFQ